MTQKSKTGRPKMEGKRRMYIVSDDAHEWILKHGGGKYITTTMRNIYMATDQTVKGDISDEELQAVRAKAESLNVGCKSCAIEGVCLITNTCTTRLQAQKGFVYGYIAAKQNNTQEGQK